MPPKKKARLPKKQKSESEHSESEADSEEQQKTTKRARKEPKKDGQPLNKTNTEFANLEFSNSTTSNGNEPWNFKIASWNVDGLRSWIKVYPKVFCSTTHGNVISNWFLNRKVVWNTSSMRIQISFASRKPSVLNPRFLMRPTFMAIMSSGAVLKRKGMLVLASIQRKSQSL